MIDLTQIISELDSLDTKRTKGPWKRSCFLIQGAQREHVTHTGMGNLPPSRSVESEANAAFITALENAWPTLRAALTSTER